ncbi:MAG: hypothetical protein JO013_00330 [Alphaproteobacteria bacterium]|nr:hypothetical protein [Alphaproteobacteria bacterium]
MKLSGAAPAAAAAAGFTASTALFWPGIALFDSVEQYRQAITGDVTDWHPPAMARLWGLLAQVWPGTAPMLLLQLGLYWLGLGLLAAALARRERRLAAWAVLLVGCGPILSCWMGAVLKDAQMLGALSAATGIGAWHPLAERKRPVAVTGLLIIFLAYATLVRANAVFATAPLGLALLGWPGLWSKWARAAACLGLVAAVLVLAPPLNRGVFGAAREGPENSLLLYDIAGTSIRAGADSAGVPAARWTALADAGCYSAEGWDALSEHGRCTIAPGLAADPDTPPLYAAWVRTIAAHPLAYAAHRLAHFNATMRWLIANGEYGAVGPVDSEPNRLGLGAPAKAAELLVHVCGEAWTSSPIGWPVLWLAFAAAGLWLSRRAPPGPATRLAQALLLSAVAGGLSYAVVSVASDLRYHLWTVLAGGLGLVLLASAGGIRRRGAVVLLAVALVVVTGGTLSRLLLPPLPAHVD